MGGNVIVVDAVASCADASAKVAASGNAASLGQTASLHCSCAATSAWDTQYNMCSDVTPADGSRRFCLRLLAPLDCLRLLEMPLPSGLTVTELIAAFSCMAAAQGRTREAVWVLASTLCACLSLTAVAMAQTGTAGCGATVLSTGDAALRAKPEVALLSCP